MPTVTLLRRLLRENVVLLVVAMLAIMPLLSPFTIGPSGRALRNGLFQSLGVLLLAVLLARFRVGSGRAGLSYWVRTGVNAPLLAFLLWAGLGLLWAPDRAFAGGELLRLGAGAVLYFALVLHLETRAQLSLLTNCVLGMVILMSGYGLLFHDSEALSGVGMWSIFPNRHHLSAVLVVLCPLLISLALGVEELGRRIAAAVAASLCGIGLLLAQERSSWIAVAVGILVLFFLRNWSEPRAVRNWRASFAVAAAGLVMVVGFLAVTDADAIVVTRTQALSSAMRGEDESLAWRLRKWRGAMAMVAQKPLSGWGPGQYPLHEYAFTRLGSPPEEVRRDGPSFDDMAYNEYLQTAAELGLPGLALYLLLLASYFSKGSRALLRLPDGLRRAVLLGALSGVGAQMVDALANGSWRYSECSIFLWLALGLGMAVTRMAYQPSPRRGTATAGDPAVIPSPPAPVGTAAV